MVAREADLHEQVILVVQEHWGKVIQAVLGMVANLQVDRVVVELAELVQQYLVLMVVLGEQPVLAHPHS